MLLPSCAAATGIAIAGVAGPSSICCARVFMDGTDKVTISVTCIDCHAFNMPITSITLLPIS
jgi:hypothetical protein